jgi:F420-0:gamma-glutamyl ligase
MQITPITTRFVQPPHDDIFAILDEYVTEFHENDILVITSKIVSIHQGRCVKNTGDRTQRQELTEQEADYLYRYDNDATGHEFSISMKHNILVSSAGIDASNGDGYFVLLPENPAEFAQDVWQYLRSRFGIAECGVIITDSHSMPMRYGATGIAIGWHGFHPLHDYIGTQDVCGRTMQVERANIVDGIAAGTVVVMGEGGESTPLAIVRDVPRIAFTEDSTTHELFVSRMEEDIFYPLLQKLNE